MTDNEIITGFRNLYVGGLAQKRRDAGEPNAMPPFQETYWLGKAVAKCPMDLWVYQEVLWETKPEILLECGTSGAGSAFFFATIFDLIGSGHVVTVDVDVYPHLRREHPRITYLVGDSVSEAILTQMRTVATGKRTMVSLDSNHTYPHVKNEIAAYSPLVSSGQYLVVEDVAVYDDSKVLADMDINDSVWGTGATAEFCKAHREFVQDRKRELHLLTSNVWLKRKLLRG